MGTFKRLVRSGALLIQVVHGQRSREHLRASATQEDVQRVIVSALDDVPKNEGKWNQMMDQTLDQMLNSSAEKETPTGATTSLFPTIICHTGVGMSGAERATELGSNLGISDMDNNCAFQYNKDDRSCLICDLSHTKTSFHTEDIYVVPMPSILKMQKGIYAGLNSFNKKGHATTASFSVQLSPRFESSFAKAGKEIVQSIPSNDINCSVEMDGSSSDTVRLKVTIHFTVSEATSCIKSLIDTVAKHPFVWSVERYYYPSSANENAQWIIQSNIRDKRPFFVSDLEGSNEVIAISDSGLNRNHCYFKDSDEKGPIPANGTIDLTRRKVVLYDAEGGDDNDDGPDQKGHGTHVCGTAAGRLSNDGIEDEIGPGDGVARDAKIAFFDVQNAGGWQLDTFDVYRIFDKGRRAGAEIHSASWRMLVWNKGTHYPEYNAYTEQARTIDKYTYENPNFLFISCAGNEGRGAGTAIDVLNTVGSPATAKNTATVGNSHNYNDSLGREYLHASSSRGPTKDGRTKPDIVAPGATILSADSKKACGLWKMIGTSMSTPAVSGTAALIRQYFKEGWYPSGERVSSCSIEPSGVLVKAVLLNGAQPLEGVNNEPSNNGVTDSVPYDNHQNFGRVNLLRSLPLKGHNKIAAKVVNQRTIRHDEGFQEYTFKVDTSSGCNETKLSATMVWADPVPATPKCTKCVLNDLDLSAVKKDDGTIFFPNGLANRDDVNNAERVQVPASADDVVTVRVKAHNLATPQQKYSLVVTGCFKQKVLIKEVRRPPLVGTENPIITKICRVLPSRSRKAPDRSDVASTRVRRRRRSGPTRVEQAGAV